MIINIGAYSPTRCQSDPTLRHVPSGDDLVGTSVTLQIRGSMALLDGPHAFVWVDLVNPTRPELLVVSNMFHLEALQIEDAANPHQRAKFDVDDGGAVFALFKVLDYEEETSGVTTGQISVFVGSGYAVTIRQGGSRDIAGVRSRIEGSDVLRGHGPVAVMYAVLDFVVDGYLAVMDEVGNDVDEIETQVFSSIPVSQLTRRIYELKRENMEVRRAVGPLVPAAHRFASETAPEVPENLRPYFRDIGEHILRVDESVDTADNLLLTMLMASTALQDLQQNKDMRKISAYAAMGVVPTVVAGIYGMNFSHMPELDWEFGYPLALGLMGLVVLLLYRAFKKSGWL